MKVYLIKDEKTGEVIRWEGTLKEFMLEQEQWFYCIITDGMRRALANTRQRGTYYRGWKVLFYGEEKPQEEPNEIRMMDLLKKSDNPQPVKFFKYEGKEEFEKAMEKHMKPKKRNVLVIGDLHLPFCLKKALEFAKRTYKENDITDVIFIGDIMDNHYTGYHESDPDGYSANDELVYAKREVQKWAKAFPNASLIMGNHDRIPNRKAFTGGISKKWIKTIDEVLNIPWSIHDSITIGNFFFTHGDGQQAKSRSVDLSMSVVQGHYHSKFFCQMVSANRKNITYAIQTGCLVDHNAFAMAYGKRGKAMARGLVVIKDIEGDVEIKLVPMPVEMLDD